MELSDFYDWLDASRALDIDREIKARQAAVYGQAPDKKVHRARTSEINSLSTQKQIYLGNSPFATDEKKIEQSWNKLRQVKVKRGNQRDKSDSQS